MGLPNQNINKAGRLTGWLAKITTYGLFLPISLVTACTDRSDEAAQFFLRGNVQLQKREYREAVRFYTEALEKKPDFADAYNNRGLAKFRNDDVAGALADYTRAIDTDPDFGAAYLNRAEARLDLGDAGGSLTDLQRIEKQYADSTFYQLRLGDTHTRLNEPARAQLAYDRAIQLDPNNVEALTNRAALFFSQKAYELARQDIANALQLNPKQDAALNNQSLLLAQAGKFADALTYVDRALSVKPTQPYYLNNKAYLLLMLNRPAEALPLVEQSIRLNDQNAWAYRTLGIYQLTQRQTGQALTALRKAEQLDPSVDALYYYIGKAEAEAGRQEAACTAWARGVTAGDQLAKAEQQKQCGN